MEYLKKPCNLEDHIFLLNLEASAMILNNRDSNLYSAKIPVYFFSTFGCHVINIAFRLQGYLNNIKTHFFLCHHVWIFHASFNNTKFIYAPVPHRHFPSRVMRCNNEKENVLIKCTIKNGQARLNILWALDWKRLNQNKNGCCASHILALKDFCILST